PRRRPREIVLLRRSDAIGIKRLLDHTLYSEPRTRVTKCILAHTRPLELVVDQTRNQLRQLFGLCRAHGEACLSFQESLRHPANIGTNDGKAHRLRFNDDIWQSLPPRG